jgi:hypothetical protein
LADQAGKPALLLQPVKHTCDAKTTWLENDVSVGRKQSAIDYANVVRKQPAVKRAGWIKLDQAGAAAACQT